VLQHCFEMKKSIFHNKIFEQIISELEQ